MIEKEIDSFWYDTFVNLIFVSDESEEPVAIFTEGVTPPIPEPGQEVQINHKDTTGDQDAEISTVGEYIVSSIEYAYNLTEFTVPDEVQEDVEEEDPGDQGHQTIVNVVIYVEDKDGEGKRADN